MIIMIQTCKCAMEILHVVSNPGSGEVVLYGTNQDFHTKQ